MKTHVSARIDSDVVAEAKEAARVARWSLTDWLEVAMINQLKREQEIREKLAREQEKTPDGR